MTGLQGRSVVNTRAPHQAEALDALLQQYGAQPLSYPCIEIAPPENASALDSALRAAELGAFTGLILTSANTVIALENQLKQLGIAPEALTPLKVAAIGPRTAEEAERRLGLRIDAIPEDYVSDALYDALSDQATGARLLLPQSDLADSALAERLRQRGAEVTVASAYRTVIGSGGVDLPDLLARGAVDAITFTSGSTVVNCFARLKNAGVNPEMLARVAVACIGPKTADVASDFGLTVSVIPTEHTLEALVAALDAYFLSLDSGALPS